MHAQGETLKSGSSGTDSSSTGTTAKSDLPEVGIMPAPTLIGTGGGDGGVVTTAVPRHPSLDIKEQVQRRMELRPDAFAWTYRDEDLVRIYDKGRELGLDGKAIGDMIFIGSRKDKPLDPGQLIVQMTNWTQRISKRGFPFRFDELVLYQKFSNLLLRVVREAGLPDTDVRIQGSSLRKEEAGDVDVGIFVTQKSFDDKLGAAFNGKAKRTAEETGTGSVLEGRPAVNAALKVTDATHEKLVALARDVRAPGNERLYNAVAKTWAHAILEGLVNSKGSALPALKKAAKAVQAKYAAQNIESLAILIQGGSFDLDPSMRVVPVEGVGE